MSLRAATAAALLLVLIASFRIVQTYRFFNHTIDEPYTLAAGIEYLSTGRYLYEDTHPPLGRVMGALGPFLAGERFRRGPEAFFEGYRILGHGDHYDRILTLGRLGILPFFWMGAAVVFLWAWRAAGGASAVAATLLYTTLPPILAHAGLMTTDMALATMCAGAGLAALYWSDDPTRRRSMLLGVVTALACVSKFSALVFLPAGWLLMWSYTAWRGGRGLRHMLSQPLQHRRAILIAAGTAFLTIWAIYGFTFARVDFLHLRLPAPRFFSGIHSVWVHNRLGHPSFILGQRSNSGFWYYFPTVLAIKTPLALFALLALSISTIWRRHERTEWALPLVFSLGILLISMRGRIDIGVRYILVVYTGWAVVCGIAVAHARGAIGRTAVAALIVWHVLSGAAQHPDYLAYTNEIAGSHPERFVADSDLDWGQDMKRLGDFFHENGVARITFSPFNRTYGAMAGHPFPEMSPGSTDAPSPGWNAVSVTIWRVFGYPAWADRIPPQQRIGRSILLWHFPEGDLNPR